MEIGLSPSEFTERKGLVKSVVAEQLDISEEHVDVKIFSSQRRVLNADESTVEVTVRTHDTTPILDEINSPEFEPELRSKLSGATEENIFVRNATVTSVTDITTTTQAAESSDDVDWPWFDTGTWIILLTADGCLLLCCGLCIGYYCGLNSGPKEPYRKQRRPSRRKSVEMTEIEGSDTHYTSPRSEMYPKTPRRSFDDTPRSRESRRYVSSGESDDGYDRDIRPRVEVWSSTARSWLLAIVVSELPEEKIEVEYEINGEPYRKKLYKYDTKKVRAVRGNREVFE